MALAYLLQCAMQKQSMRFKHDDAREADATWCPNHSLQAQRSGMASDGGSLSHPPWSPTASMVQHWAVTVDD